MGNMRMRTMMTHVLFSEHVRMTYVKIIIISFDLKNITRKIRKMLQTQTFLNNHLLH